MDTGFARTRFLETLPWAALAILVVLVITYVASRVTGRHSVIDTAWGLLFLSAALAAFVSSATGSSSAGLGASGSGGSGSGDSGSGDTVRRWLLLIMVGVWGLRLAIHIGRRSIGKGEDPRYAEMLRDRGRVQTILLVYGLQGVLAFVVSAPLIVGPFERAPVTPLAYLGVAIWAVGLVFEAVGDWQMEQFKAAKAAGTASGVMDRGLWRYTRHPNYFGDACVWVGIFLVTAERWPGVLTVFSPLIMIYLLAFGSGKRVLERSMAQRPGYRKYMAETSGFIPWPSKTSRTSD